MKISKFVTAIVTSAILSFHQNPANATVYSFVIGGLNDGDIDQVCKNVHSSAYVTSFNPERSASVCVFPAGIEVSTNSGGGIEFGLTNIGGSINWGTSKTVLQYDVNQSVDHTKVCLHKYNNSGFTNPRWSWQNQSCIGEQDVVETQPQLKVVGTIGHNQFWAYCSGNNYRSYYDHGFSLQCGYQEWTQGQPEGDYFDYQDVCRYVYGDGVFYSGDTKACSIWQ